MLKMTENVCRDKSCIGSCVPTRGERLWTIPQYLKFLFLLKLISKILKNKNSTLHF